MKEGTKERRKEGREQKSIRCLTYMYICEFHLLVFPRSPPETHFISPPARLDGQGYIAVRFFLLFWFHCFRALFLSIGSNLSRPEPKRLEPRTNGAVQATVNDCGVLSD